MAKSYCYRLRVVIPVLVFTVTLLIDGYQTVHRLRDTRDFIVSNTGQTLGFKMNELQSILSDMMLHDERDRAQQTIANAALDHQIVTILLTDEKHRVLFANRRDWLGAPAASVTRYDPAEADKTLTVQSCSLTRESGRFIGYYPVTLGLGEGELRPKQTGTLFVEYDFTGLLDHAERETYADAVKLLSFSIVLALALLYGLHCLITKRIERLLLAMHGVSAGNLEVRAGMHGHGEIDRLARAFDEMAAELANQQRDLHQQAEELEQEVAERQSAQEGLQEQTVLLEEEIAERLKFEESLKEASLFNQQIIDGAKEGIVVYDRSLCYRLWNPFMEKLSGITAEEVLGQRPLDLFPFLEGAGVFEDLQRVLAGEQVEDREYPFHVLKSGKSGWVSHASTQLKDLKGEIIGVIAMVRDMTFHKKTEEQLRQSQKMEAIGQLAGGIAHDFNNILTVVIGCGEMLKSDPELSKHQGDHLNHILCAADRAAQLTRGLLAFSRKQVMTPKVLDLNDLVQQVQQFLVRVVGEDMQLKTVCHRSSLKVKADAGQLEQVLVNLVTNARDAMPDGGLLSIETGCQEVERLQSEASEGVHSGSYALITVSDTGHGMDEETRKRIFEPFFTTKDAGKGTGLGMSIVHGIVSQHGGFIKVYSEPGKGTCFKVYLPLLREDQAAQDDATAPLPPPKRGNETVLVAEDDAEIREMFASVLREYGYRVILAEDGEDALEKFAAHRDEIKLNILDIIMPKKNGVEVNEAIRVLQPEGVRTLFSTGYTKDIIQRRGELADSEEIINKPVRPLDLLRKVREILDRA